ncbi:MAG TPA: hemerythrin domain-containing protein [Pirellulaceae bacterium]|nr:hemerythrin domain-containing protein [Pirellulaceae bacterium]
MATVTRVVTKTITVNAAFLREIKEVHEDLWRAQQQLRDMCSRPMSLRDDATGFVELLGRFRDELAMHFSLEEAYGYFNDPVEVAPRLDKRAHELRAEHESLYREIAALVERAEECLYHDRRAELLVNIPLAFGVFDDQLGEHEHRETALILAAFDDDLGVGD